MPIYRFVIRFQEQNDPRSKGLIADARALGFNDLTHIACQDLYFVEGQMTAEQCRQLALGLFADPVTQSADWDALPAACPDPGPGIALVEVALRHGVTDPVADEIVRAAHEMGLDGVRQASTGWRYLLHFGTSVAIRDSMTKSVVERLLANAVIHRWTIGEIEPFFPLAAESSGAVERIDVMVDDKRLLAISKERRAALDLAEMQAIRSYCEREGRDLTDVEFEAIAQTWSEHCGHKTFKARITLDDGRVVDSLLKTYLKTATEKIAAPWVISAFVDNAGIIDLDGEHEVSFKVETHNHPSAIEPFGGANTGVGGVIRDVLGVSHKPIANTDVLCFGLQEASFDDLPSGVLHPRRIMAGVVAGVQDYGNKIGIPTVGGAILFDPGYAANPLVFCGTVGIAPKGWHARSPQVGDRVIVLGGGTGRDGLRGATFSSMTMDAQTGEVSGSSVQIGNPIVEKGLIDAILPARDEHLYTAITDCGAGGLSSAVGEMSSQVGAEVDLTDVRLKYPGLAPWEIWLSEAQERMVLAVPPIHLARLQDLCDTFNVDLTDIGEFTGSGRLVVRYAGRAVLDLENEFLHEGIPQRRLQAVLPNTAAESTDKKEHLRDVVPPPDFQDILLRLLAHPNIASRASVIRIYDHEVQGGTVVKPLTGVRDDGPSDACVLKPPGVRGRTGIAISHGINPEYGKRDAYRMALAVIDEAVRNAVAVGTNPERIAVLDNFCWGDPLRPETLGTLFEAARGCHDGALRYGTPFISGKDSLNNEYLGTDGQRHAIPPTLLISAVGVVEDVAHSVTMDLKAPGDLVYLVGAFAPTFGGSHFDLVHGDDPSSVVEEPVPSVCASTPAVYRALHKLIHDGLVRAAHDLSEGGLAVAAAEMALAGRLGLRLDLPLADPTRTLFGETTGCLLVEVQPEQRVTFESALADLPVVRIGLVADEPVLAVAASNQSLFSVPISDLAGAWRTPLQ
ncbi:MAG: phosphoribosylformylglycinamidine synthase subunit PurL [Anaerolineales bacterium]|nr:phosphoribosylformylglycinamidine synthase subunit PurL [Anaerolineales bacterium]